METTSPASPQRFADMPDVHEHVAVALERVGLTTAFPVQEAVVPVATTGRDVLVMSPTGSGKTLAFGLPIIAQIERGSRTPSAVILVPGRELAIQVRDELVPIAWALQQRVVAVHGGGAGHRQGKQAAGAPIIVATPGRLVDLIRQRVVNLSRATMLVLDEADRMLDMGFAPQVKEIVQAMPRRSQTMLFSATLEGRVGKVGRELTHDPVRIELDELPGAGGEIEHVLVSTHAAAKADSVAELLQHEERDLAVVFVRTQKGASNLCETLCSLGLRATTIHGGMTQPERLREYATFQRGDADVLVATDVFARGMDLDRITHVINYELPEDADMYRHRIGRTGRAGRAGTAITLVTNQTKKIVEQLLIELDLSAELLTSMRPGAATRAVPVPEHERYVPAVKLNEEDPLRPRATERRTDRGDHGGKTFEDVGNGRGKRLTKAAPSKGAQAGGSGRGTISTYDPRKGFGFIKQSDGGKDVFFHRRAVSGKVEDRSLRPGVPVSFGLEQGTGSKLRATRVAVQATRSGNNGNSARGNNNARGGGNARNGRRGPR